MACGGAVRPETGGETKKKEGTTEGTVKNERESGRKSSIVEGKRATRDRERTGEEVEGTPGHARWSEPPPQVSLPFSLLSLSLSLPAPRQFTIIFNKRDTVPGDNQLLTIPSSLTTGQGFAPRRLDHRSTARLIYRSP